MNIANKLRIKQFLCKHKIVDYITKILYFEEQEDLLKISNCKIFLKSCNMTDEDILKCKKILVNIYKKYGLYIGDGCSEDCFNNAVLPYINSL